MPTIEKIFPEYIRLDGGTQPRAKINQAVCDDYGERMKAGEEFPAIDVFFDGENYWLADGFHRVQAYVMAVPGEAIECNVYQGTLQDAQWHSYGVNKAHGLRRTPTDKERAVRAALAHTNGTDQPDRQIAEYVGVSHPFVAKIRAKLELSGNVSRCASRTVTRGKSTYQQNTTHIGKNPKKGKGKGKGKKQRNRISPDAATPVLGHSLPNPVIALNLSPTNPVMAAATIFKLFDSTFVRDLIAELTQRLKGQDQ